MWIKHFIMSVVGATRIEIGRFIILGCGIIFLVADGVSKLLVGGYFSEDCGWLVGVRFHKHFRDSIFHEFAFMEADLTSATEI